MTNTETVKLSTVLSALSYALDLTEGQPPGHAARACLIGMRLADALGLLAAKRSDLFYALLMKDAGCSSNAAHVYQLFGGDDQTVKQGLWRRDWRSWRERLAFAREHVDPEGSVPARLRRYVTLATSGWKAHRESFRIRCERGADIAHALGMPQATALAIKTMDEHWDGGGYPDGIGGERIPLYARIIGLAQVAEIYWRLGGPQAPLDVVRQRRGRWFDPELVRVFSTLHASDRLWLDLQSVDLQDTIAAAKSIESAVPTDSARLDRIAHAFALVVDAKSSFTYRHSDRVASIAVSIAHEMGLPDAERVRLRRAGLLHDIGKLSVPNRILDKPGRLDDEEWRVVRRHPHFTYEILTRVPVFSEFAYDASAHHERLDGRGYHRGIGGDQLSRHARILTARSCLSTR